MKKVIYIIAVLAVLLLPTSCSDKDNYEYNHVDAPALLTFGFYSEDNSMLAKDYVVDLSDNVGSGTSTQSVSVALPATVDKTSLVARFTTSDGTVVRVDGEEQVSATTVHDYSLPIDYILTRNGVNRRYEVTVTKSPMHWQALPVFDDATVYTEAVLQLHPQTYRPYVGFKTRATNVGTANCSAVVMLDDDDQWQWVGGSTFGNEVNSSYFDFDIAPNGTPYVVYSDKAATVLKNAASVMKYNGTDWEFVGTDQGILSAVSAYASIAALNDEIVVAQVNSSKTGGFARYGQVLSVYKDGTWNSQINGNVSNNVYMANAAAGTDAAYVISINRSTVSGVDYGYNILRYQNGEWTPMLINYLEPGNNINNIAMIGITVTADEVPYYWTMDNADGQLGIRIKYYDFLQQTWLTLGGNTMPFGFTPDRYSRVSVDVAPDGTPYVAYINQEGGKDYPYLIYLDQETNQWSSPVQLSDVAASEITIKFTPSGVGYVCFVGDSDYKIHLLRTDD